MNEFYINTFNEPPDSTRYFAVWGVNLVSKDNYESTYIFSKKIYDPFGKFKRSQQITLSSFTYAVIRKKTSFSPGGDDREDKLVTDEYGVVKRIFRWTNKKI